MGLEIPWLVEEAETVPGFEGFEKRLEVEFSSDAKDKLGLRAISRGNIDRMLKAAECTIVAKLSNEEFDSYVLSESSLFVYPCKMVIKTCGTTKLLRTIPLLLELSKELGLAVKSCKYSRGTFFFPQQQAFPHRNFSDEVSYLNRYFGNLGSGGRGYVLGSPTSSHKWYVYVASTEYSVKDLVNKPSFTMEMCMTELDRGVACKFFKERNSTALRMTESTGIDGILPNAKICDFAFDPCGYSMNSVEGGAYSTIHVTPEEACSYASFETLGYGPENVDLKALLNKVLKCFKPGFFSVAIYARGSTKGLGSWGYSVCPDGYSCVGSNRQVLANGEVVVYHTFRRLEGCERDWMVDPEPLMAINGGGVELDVKKQWLWGTEIDKLKALEMVQLVSRLARSVQPAA